MGNAMLIPAQTMSHGEDFEECDGADGSEPFATDFSLEFSIWLFDVFCSGVKVSQKYSNRVDF
jgi:hypothetical protein